MESISKDKYRYIGKYKAFVIIFFHNILNTTV